MLLMCGNTPILDLETYEVLNQRLLPGNIASDISREAFKRWAQNRYSSNTNAFARKLKGITFGQGNRPEIDRITRSLSLSDAYWLKEYDGSVQFEDVSPYFTDFWNGDGIYNGTAIPTLYTDGFLAKYWLNKDWLYKESTLLEITCSQLCSSIGVPAVEVKSYKQGIIVKNFTSPSIMFEPASVSGRIDPDDFVEDDIIRVFGDSGFDMILVDAIIGNGDRHAGNFGFLRDTGTGEYLGMAPLFDFDHALDTGNRLDDRLLTDIISLAKKYGKTQRVCEIASKVTELDTEDILKKRAEILCKKEFM